MALFREHIVPLVSSILVEEASEDTSVDLGHYFMSDMRKRLNRRHTNLALSLATSGNRSISRRRFEPAVNIKNYIAEVVHNYDDVAFKSHFRMARTSVEVLMAKVAENTTSRSVTIETKTLASLWTLANQESFRGVGDRFGVERGQLQRIFVSFCDTVSDIKQEYIQWPSGEDALVNMQEFEERWGFPNVVGAIDGTDVAIKPPQANRDSYINRKGVPAIKTQAVCDHRMRFIDVYSGWPGSVHDARMFRNSPLSQHLSDNDFMPANAHLLGDAAYPLQVTLMTPFRDNGHLSEAQKRYNRMHSTARTVIERSFAMLKGKWRRLKYLDMDLMEKVPCVIMTACVLHNLILKLERAEEADEEVEGVTEENQCGPEDHARNTAAAEKRRHIVNML